MALPEIFRSRSLFSELFRDLEDLLPSLSTMQESFRPMVRVDENENSFVLDIDLPGVRQEDVKIDVNDDVLTVSGERKSKSSREGSEEESYRSFRQSLSLPRGTDINKIEANYENGCLEITIPKSQLAQSRSIQIKAGQGAQKQVGDQSQASINVKKQEQPSETAPRH